MSFHRQEPALLNDLADAMGQAERKCFIYKGKGPWKEMLLREREKDRLIRSIEEKKEKKSKSL